MTARNELDKAVQRITELEENLIGKQVLIDSLVTENEDLKELLADKVTHLLSFLSLLLNGRKILSTPLLCFLLRTLTILSPLPPFSPLFPISPRPLPCIHIPVLFLISLFYTAPSYLHCWTPLPPLPS